ncbi:MAG: ANTAR domain-containing protein, partial [Catenulispora sp.]|nr:ANTAR domain-containing protein [Catenulispora sp.]
MSEDSTSGEPVSKGAVNDGSVNESAAAGEQASPVPDDFTAHRDRLVRERRDHRWDALVDQAVGVVIARSGCGSAEAVAQLAAVAGRSGRPLRAVAA